MTTPGIAPAIESNYVTVNGLDLHYLEAGSGTPVLFLHGWPTNAQLWRHVLPEVGAFRRAIALDLPGFGKSSKPTDVRYGFTFFEEVLSGFVSALNIDRLGLGVHDLGGPVGLYWAAKNRDRVIDLAILNTLVFPELSWAVKLFVLSTYAPGVSQFVSSQRGLAGAMRFGVQDKSRITREVAALYQEPFVDSQSRRALLKTAQGLGAGGMRFIGGELPNFTMPVCILYGEEDRILPDVAKTMSRVKEQIPHASLASLPNCGHFLQEDRPDDVATALASFFSETQGATAA